MALRLSLDALLVLDAIERKGSFSAAADELHRVPSAMTYTVHKLEEDLDVKIFDRTGHRATLTRAGRELLDQGRHLLRAAGELESRVKRVATGWETELRIVYDDVIRFEALFPLLDEFYREPCGTRLRISAEVLGGCWDALVSDRADLAIGAPGDGPAGGGYATALMGSTDWVFAVARDHPLAKLPEPLKADAILTYRSVSIADTSRNLPPRTSGILSGQETLTVHSMQTKIAAQRLGLGVGYLPRHLAEPEAQAGRLVIKATEEEKPDIQHFLAWRSANHGRALQWLVKRLRDPIVMAALLTFR